MKAHQWLVVSAAAIFALTGSAALAQERQDHTQFDEKDQKAVRDYYSQHQAHPPAGLREKDRLSPDEESRLREGAVMDKDLRRRVHPAPPELERQLPPPPRDHRYVAVGGHIGLIDNKFQVKAVIHLH